MCALASHADSIASGAPSRVLGCERVEVGAFSVLLRVTVALEGVPPRRAAGGARLVVLDRGQERRERALPGPVPAQAAVLSLGFALVPDATAVALELDGRRLTLPAPRVRPLGAPASLAERLAAPNARASLGGAAPASVERRSLANALRAAEQQLGATEARLQEARATSVRIEAERDEARRAAAHAEAAAHDATARAEALASGPLIADGPVPRGMSRRRTLAGAVCALGTGALVVGLLVWPGGGSAGDGGGSAVAAAKSSSIAADLGATAVALVDPLAGRLGIPPEYLSLYRQAGARYGLDWTRLAAVGAVESVHGQALAAGVTSGANHRGASGPAQFLAATWDRFGVDGDADGVRDPHDPADAIPAMASYLRASGAPEDWRGALRTYNHSDVYASAVERVAASYRRGAG